MNLEDIKQKLEIQFVDDFDNLNDFMMNINNTLEKINIDNYYDYNTFCLDIEKTIFDLIKETNSTNITPDLLSNALNTMIKYKIIEDPDYEEKLNNFFDDGDDFIEEIKKIKK